MSCVYVRANWAQKLSQTSLWDIKIPPGITVKLYLMCRRWQSALIQLWLGRFSHGGPLDYDIPRLCTAPD
jgi:hypothetical protein